MVTLRFSRKSLLYDIENYAYIEGDVMGEERQHAQHTLVDIGEDGNVDRVNRILGVVHAGVVEMLYPYTKDSELDEYEEVDDRMWVPKEYVVDMTVPEGFSRTTVHLLAKLIHEYMVCMVLYDWLLTTNAEAAGNWRMKADEAKEEIESIRNLRTGKVRRRCHPF